MVIGIDYPATSANVTVMGLVGVVAEKVQPMRSEVQAIIDCTDYVRSMHEQISQWQPSSLAFWDAFANVSACDSALTGAADTLSSGESDTEATALGRVAGFTADFFRDVLPKLIGLAGDTEI